MTNWRERQRIIAEKQGRALGEEDWIIIQRLLYFAEVGKAFQVNWQMMPLILRGKAKRYRLKNGLVWRTS